MKRFKRILKWFFISLFTVVALSWLVLWLFIQSWLPKPPPLPINAAATLPLKVEEREGKRWVRRCWLDEREEVPVLYLTGTPFEMGYANGLLTQDRMHRLEDAAIGMVRQFVPSDWKFFLVKNYVIYRNRNLQKFASASHQMEILGMVHGCPDAHPEIAPYFARVLNYHAAHDISYMLIDNPLVTVASSGGCTAFGALGRATADSHLLTGRNFDWEADPIFDRDRVIVLCEPNEGIPFVSLSWAGMVGVVSGMNRAGISVTVNGAPSDLPDDIGTPAALVARDILQHAHNLTEAITMLRDARVFVSTIWLIGSRADGKFVVVEKTPDVTHVREPSNDQIVCANHFQTDNLKDDQRNVTFSVESTSVARSARLSELLEQSRGTLTAARAAEILRDRKLMGGVFAGNGNRASLNPFIATHSTVMDLTEGIFWAAATPHQLGKFVAFDVNNFSGRFPEKNIAADSMLANGEFGKYEQAQKFLADGQRSLKEGDAKTALELAEKAESLNPGFYQNSALKGRALLALGKRDEAMLAFTTALAAVPAFAREKGEMETLLQHARGSPSPR